MEDNHSNRFKDAPWFPKENAEVIVGGAGGIGSWLTILLARTSTPNIMVYDFDLLEAHNMAGQLYPVEAVGKLKVEALAETVKSFTGTTILGFNEKLTKDTPSTNIMFGAFDNMEARKSIFDSWMGFVEIWKTTKEKVDKGETTWENEGISPVTPLLIDGRLTLEQIQIFSVTPELAEEYEKEYLFPDGDVEDEVCTLKQTSHTAAMIGGHMVGFYTNHLANEYSGEASRNVPFKWEYFTPVDLCLNS